MTSTMFAAVTNKNTFNIYLASTGSCHRYIWLLIITTDCHFSIWTFVLICLLSEKLSFEIKNCTIFSFNYNFQFVQLHSLHKWKHSVFHLQVKIDFVCYSFCNAMSFNKPSKMCFHIWISYITIEQTDNSSWISLITILSNECCKW